MVYKEKVYQVDKCNANYFLTSTLHPQSRQLYPSKPSSNTDLPLLCIKDHSPFAGIFLHSSLRHLAEVFLYLKPHELHNCPSLIDQEGLQHGD
mmetsp:Transcript_215/g.244  ORF Transcript_215/g.244 Transcript_215/m.244 type:complete len:93 (+) Transcript_215:117-395(+)